MPPLILQRGADNECVPVRIIALRSGGSDESERSGGVGSDENERSGDAGSDGNERSGGGAGSDESDPSRGLAASPARQASPP